MTTAVAETKPKRDAQRFLQAHIPKLIKAFHTGGFEGAYAAFPDFDHKIVRNKLIKLEVAESSRPQILEEHKDQMGPFVESIVDQLIEKFGQDGKINASYLRSTISGLRDMLPPSPQKLAAAKAKGEDAA